MPSNRIWMGCYVHFPVLASSYSTVDWEDHAIVLDFKINRTLIQGYPVLVHTDHRLLRYLFDNKDSSFGLARCCIAVDYLLEKENSLAEVLSQVRAADQRSDELVVGAIATHSGNRTREAFEQSDGVWHSSKDLNLEKRSSGIIKDWSVDGIHSAQDSAHLWKSAKIHLAVDLKISGRDQRKMFWEI